MDNIVLVLCDIQGTILGNIENNNFDYGNFKVILNSIENKYHGKIHFSLVSSTNAEYMYKVRDVLKTYIPYITKYPQFFYNGYLINDNFVYLNYIGKISQINKYIKYMVKKYNIQKIIYIDDNDIFHEMLFEINSQENWINKLESIIPKNFNGLSETNKLLSKSLKKKN